MGKRTSYTAGTFSWVDLATTDAAAAQAFYAGLFGWTMEDHDAGEGAVYTMCRRDGDAVAGLATGAPPAWTGYVTVEDADATAARAAELGGRVVAAPSDVFDLGRRAVLADPQGAVFATWQPGTRIGADRVNEPGCLCMNELVTSDVEAARMFYEGLFGWTTEAVEIPGDHTPVGFVHNAGAINGSIFAAPEGVAPHWRACFAVEATDAALRRVRELGGAEAGPVQDIGDGSLAVVRDPQGAVFSLFAGETDP